jgi:hypothetical protein
MKTLKFRPNLISLILSGEKTSTWRLFDDKDLQKNDEVEFLSWETKEPFAKVVFTEVFEKRLGDLTDKERGGHEEYENNEEMLRMFSIYYNKDVTLMTPVKVLRFKIIESLPRK